MKSLYLLALALGSSAFGQTITFKGCYNLFEDQTYTFTKTGLDANNKGIYVTTPVNGDQACGHFGTCEFKIQWNNTLTRWEFLVDTGGGDFINPHLAFYNSTGNNAASNPPANNYGTWVENIAVTNGDCGGNLTAANSTMTGDIHSSNLGTSTSELTRAKIQIFPNPVSEIISISGIENAQTVEIYNMAGQLVRTEDFAEKINVSSLSSGTYVLRIKTKESKILEFKFVKK